MYSADALLVWIEETVAVRIGVFYFWLEFESGVLVVAVVFFRFLGRAKKKWLFGLTKLPR
jgi:hypothetical protein